MQAIENVNVFVTGVFPDAEADNSTTAVSQDGFEFIAEYINNSVIGNQQDWLDYAGLTPNGVTEAAGFSQVREAIQLGNAIGPGWVSRRDIFDDPSVHGDRSLLLAQQGVLIASYVPLDAAVYVGDANNAAVHAAGGYYYRSSDAGGLTPNIAGPYLQLPPNPSPVGLKQYLGDGTDFSITSTPAVSSLVRAVAIPYQTSDGAWRLNFNVEYQVASAVRTNAVMTMSGVTVKTGTNQAISANQMDLNTPFMARNYAATTFFNCFHASATTTQYTFSGDVELNAKPTWAKVFDIKHAITF